MSETFDTLAAAQTLRNKGMDSGHAEGVVEVVRNAQSELATKADIKGVNDRIDALGENMRTEIKGLDGRIDSLGESLRTEMKALSQELKAEMKILGDRISAIQWAGAVVAGVLTAAVTATLAIVAMQVFQA